MHPWGRGASQPRADRWPTVPDSVDHRGTAGSSGAVRRNDVNGARCDVVYYQGRRGHSAETQGTGEAFWTSTAPSLVYQRQVSTARSHQLCPSDHDITPENAPLRQNIPPVVETRTLGDQQDEDQEENREKQSPSSSSTDQKKPRKRPHYLSHEVRCQIIERIAGGEQQAALAREFGVTRAAVCHIQKHRFEILSRPVAQQTGDEDTIPTGPALDQQLVHEVRTSSMFLLLTTLRDRRTDVSTFRRAAGRVIMILLEDVLGQLDSRPVEIVTANGHVATGIERRSPLCGVKLGDEGHPFSVLFHQLEVDAAEGKLYVNRATDERGRRYWRLEGMNLPASIALCKVLLFTATCSTGERECKAIEALCGVGTMEKDITLVSIMCASDAVVTVCSRFPQVRIVTAAIDSSVDPRTEYIIPGLGNFIARYYNEDVRFNV